MAYEAGRPVDLMNALKHELQVLPASLVESTGELRFGDEFSLMNVLSKGIATTPSVVMERDTAHLIVDADIIVRSIGNPKKIQTFGDYASLFAEEIKSLAIRHKRIDILFNQLGQSIIKQKTEHLNSVRRVIQDEHVPLPKNWKLFLSNIENQKDLAKFLSTVVSGLQFEDTDVVLSGAMDNNEVYSSNANIDTRTLQTSHESLTTRIVLHAIQSIEKTVTISTACASAGIVALRHFDKMKCEELWMEIPTPKAKQYLPLHHVASAIQSEARENLLAYHALTGCESTSYLYGVTKLGSWEIFTKHVHLLTNFRRDTFSEAKNSAEAFMVKLYKVDESIDSANVARYVLFRKLKKLDKLPPTSDALELHMKRAFYQKSMWELAPIGIPHGLLPEDYGWKLTAIGQLVPILMSLDPCPVGLLEIIACNCGVSRCARSNCKCRKNKVSCTPLCHCTGDCLNTVGLLNDS